MSLPERIAMQRMPSSLRSNTQFGSENRSSVSTAFIAPAVRGAGAGLTISRSSAVSFARRSVVTIPRQLYKRDPMPVSALLLALAAAVVHAAWNLLLSGTEDTHSASAVALVVGTLVFLPVAVIGWRFQSSAVPYVAASSALELVYLVLLATAYSVAAMGFVYPIARGSAPVLVLAAGAVVTGTRVSGPAALGVLLVAAGIVLVRGLRRAGRPRDLALALSVGICIAGYTLVDKHG